MIKDILILFYLTSMPLLFSFVIMYFLSHYITTIYMGAALGIIIYIILGSIGYNILDNFQEL